MCFGQQLAWQLWDSECGPGGSGAGGGKTAGGLHGLALRACRPTPHACAPLELALYVSCTACAVQGWRGFNNPWMAEAEGDEEYLYVNLLINPERYTGERLEHEGVTGIRRAVRRYSMTYYLVRKGAQPLLINPGQERSGRAEAR